MSPETSLVNPANAFSFAVFLSLVEKGPNVLKSISKSCKRALSELVEFEIISFMSSLSRVLASKKPLFIIEATS